MIHLPDITLVMIAGWQRPSEAALADTLRRFTFPDVIVFANEPMQHHKTVVTSIQNYTDADRVKTFIAPAYIQTEFALFIDWDGYPVRPDRWIEHFRDFDFIGAPWPWFTDHAVGNTGFCLRSKKLMHVLANDPSVRLGEQEDVGLSRLMRPYLESVHNIRYAPRELASVFAVEHGSLGQQAFGFHGIWNILTFMSDDEVKARLDLMEDEQWQRVQMSVMSNHALLMGRNDLYLWICQEIMKRRLK
jgi:hypothetical protein